jgi:energy-coupling factor transporter transmembrane protein EcfT
MVVCQVADPTGARGLVALAVVGGGWSWASGMGARAVVRWLGLGLVLFLPFFLLAPWIEGGEVVVDLPVLGTVSRAGVLVPSRIVLRGVACLVLGAGLVAVSSPTRVAQGLASWPVPRVVSAVTFQVLRWTEVLVRETERMAQALVLRGGSQGSWRLLAALPVAWLPRVAARADRVAMAMELRGYRGELPEREGPGPGLPDALALAACVVAAWWVAA